ncbi:Hypothetical protein A7982_08244 [Minicystis rosea]|nr:Hypothetical protein A7982_08244 [Minicystis rosea]
MKGRMTHGFGSATTLSRLLARRSPTELLPSARREPARRPRIVSARLAKSTARCVFSR